MLTIGHSDDTIRYNITEKRKEKQMTRQAVLSDQATRFFAKDVLKMTEGKDPVDVLNDLELVKKVIEGELKKCLRK